MDVDLTRLLAGMVSLPRPVPLNHLAALLETTKLQVVDFCADLAPGIRLDGDVVGFADEDYEGFARTRCAKELADIRQRAARWLLSQADDDPYAAAGVAALLVDAQQGEDLLKLIESDPLPKAIPDPIVRNEVAAQRLRLAIKVCRSAGDTERALRFVLIGADGVKTEAAMQELLTSNPDLAVRFAASPVERMIFSDPDNAADHGAFLCQRMAVDADRRDAFSVREDRRALRAWFETRQQREEVDCRGTWEVGTTDIVASLEATWKLDGPLAAARELKRWRPRTVWLEVALHLLYRLIAQGRASEVETLAKSGVSAVDYLVMSVPLALAGREIDVARVIEGLGRIAPSRLRVAKFLQSHVGHPSTHWRLLDLALTAVAILIAKGAATDPVDRVLDEFLQVDLRRIDELYANDTLKLDLILRAFALRETRAGRAPTANDVFAPRPAPTETAGQPRSHDNRERHDRDLLDVVRPLFGIYAATADALVNRCSDAQLVDELRNALTSLDDGWLRGAYEREPLRRRAASQLDVLLACGYAPEMVKRCATEVHGSWGLA